MATLGPGTSPDSPAPDVTAPEGPAPDSSVPDAPADRPAGTAPRGRMTLGILTLALVALVALAWVAPPAAIVVIWPVLFVVPGWLLVARAVPAISPAGRTGAAIVVSVYLSAHVVNVVALATGGFSRAAIVASGAALIALSWILARARLRWLADPPPLSGGAAWRAIRRRPGPWIVAGAAVAIVGFVLGASAWHQVGDAWVSGGTNWSDFLVHVSIGSSIAAGNFPPQVPYFAGEPLTYHWFADFHGAIASTVAGVDIIPVYLVTSALFAGALALVTWELAFRLTRSTRVALIATVLVLFGGGMGWIRLAIDLANGAGDLLFLVARYSYDNSWDPDPPFFHIASVFGTGLLAHRATTLGLPGLVTAVLLAQMSLGKTPGRHGPRRGRRRPPRAVQLLRVPGHVSHRRPALPRAARVAAADGRAGRRPVRRAGGARRAVHPRLGRPAGGRRLDAPRRGLERGAVRRRDPGRRPLLPTNLGIPFVLAIAALFYRRTPSRLFLGAWLVALFLVPNVIVATAVAFDMNKYFQAMWVAVGILAAWAIHRWPRPLIVLVIAASVVSPRSWGRGTSSRTASRSRPRRSASGDGSRRTRPSGASSSPRPSSTRRWTSPAGSGSRRSARTSRTWLRPGPREADVTSAYCNGPDVAARVMQRYGATYALSFGGYLACPDGGTGTDFASSPLFELVHEDQGVAVYRLR